MSLFKVLGAISVGSDLPDTAPFASPKARALLAALLLRPDQWIPKQVLAEYVWPQPPQSTDANLRTYATELRRALNTAHPGLGARLLTRRGGGGGGGGGGDFRLRVVRPEVDSWTFQHLTARGRSQLRGGQPVAAMESLTSALSLWRSTPGTDLPDTVPFQDHVTALVRQHWDARLDHAHACVLLDEPATAVPTLEKLATEEPLAERPARLLMRAHHQLAEPKAALTVYHDYRERLADHTGTDPSDDMDALFRRILRRSALPAELAR